VEHLHSLLSALEAEQDVAAIERFRDPARLPAPAVPAAAR
jgi:hypothetical protein